MSGRELVCSPRRVATLRVELAMEEGREGVSGRSLFISGVTVVQPMVEGSGVGGISSASVGGETSIVVVVVVGGTGWE